MIKNIPYFKKFNKIIIAFFIVFFNVLIIFFPQNIVTAAREGLILWLNSVLPALLPFIFITNLLMGLGIINLLGTILGSVMNKLFNVSGVGGLAMAVGFTSGYPIGAKVVSDLRLQNKISKTQAERLLSFCNNSGPLFILGTVGITMFQNPLIGKFILIIHYISAIVTGILFKYYKYDENKNKIKKNYNKINLNYKESLKAAIKTQNYGSNSFSKLFTDSIVGSVQTILTIGGFIIIFNVLLELIDILLLPILIATFLSTLLLQVNIIIDEEIIRGVFYGIIEITNGTSYLSNNNNIFSVLATVFVISFGGLSIHSQSISFISKTDINIKIYLFGKFLHGLISIGIGMAFYPLFF